MNTRAYELLKALREVFAYGFPVYPDSPIGDGKETFMDRVIELLGENPQDNHEL